MDHLWPSNITTNVHENISWKIRTDEIYQKKTIYRNICNKFKDTRKLINSITGRTNDKRSIPHTFTINDIKQHILKKQLLPFAITLQI